MNLSNTNQKIEGATKTNLKYLNLSYGAVVLIFGTGAILLLVLMYFMLRPSSPDYSTKSMYTPSQQSSPTVLIQDTQDDEESESSAKPQRFKLRECLFGFLTQ